MLHTPRNWQSDKLLWAAPCREKPGGGPLQPDEPLPRRSAQSPDNSHRRSLHEYNILGHCPVYFSQDFHRIKLGHINLSGAPGRRVLPQGNAETLKCERLKWSNQMVSRRGAHCERPGLCALCGLCVEDLIGCIS